MEDQKVKDKYQERVRALAEKMAASCYDEAFATFTILPPGTVKLFKDLTTGQKEMMVNRILPAARIAVAEMASMAEKIFTGAYDGECLDYVFRWNGLIPDDGQESAFEKAIRETAEKNTGKEGGSDGNK